MLHQHSKSRFIVNILLTMHIWVSNVFTQGGYYFFTIFFTLSLVNEMRVFWEIEMTIVLEKL